MTYLPKSKDDDTTPKNKPSLEIIPGEFMYFLSLKSSTNFKTTSSRGDQKYDPMVKFPCLLCLGYCRSFLGDQSSFGENGHASRGLRLGRDDQKNCVKANVKYCNRFSQYAEAEVLRNLSRFWPGSDSATLKDSSYSCFVFLYCVLTLHYPAAATWRLAFLS